MVGYSGRCSTVVSDSGRCCTRGVPQWCTMVRTTITPGTTPPITRAPTTRTLLSHARNADPRSAAVAVLTKCVTNGCFKKSVSAYRRHTQTSMSPLSKRQNGVTPWVKQHQKCHFIKTCQNPLFQQMYQNRYFSKCVKKTVINHCAGTRY